MGRQYVIPHQAVGQRRKGRIDLSEAIRSTRAPAKLREPAVFRKVKPSGHGFGVAWPDGVEIGADTLYWLYRRQNGLRDAADELHTWRISHGLPLDMAAEEIGVSRRLLSYYEARKWPVPKTVVLALSGWEAQRHVGVQEHFRRRGERPRHGERHHRPVSDRRRVAQASLVAGPPRSMSTTCPPRAASACATFAPTMPAPMTAITGATSPGKFLHRNCRARRQVTRACCSRPR